MKILLISIFGVLGVLSRYSLDSYFSQKNLNFPLSTFIANIIGCIICGSLFYLINQKTNSNIQVYQALIIGFCGGLTTFSSYSLQVFNMINTNDFIKAFSYLFLSTLFGCLSIFLGMKIAQSLN